MADINDRLDRLHRREAFDQRAARPVGSTPESDAEPAPDRPGSAPPVPPASPAPTARAAPQVRHRSGLPQRAPGQAASAHARLAAPAQPAPARPAPERPAMPRSMPVAVPRPAGVDDRLGEVLDAVAEVVRRHRGLSVMVAIADGRAGRPVIRVSERAGGVVVGVVGAATEPAPPPHAPRPEPAAEPPDPASAGVRRASASVAVEAAEPASGAVWRAPEPVAAEPPDPASEPASAEPDRSTSDPATASPRPGGRHAAPSAEEHPAPRPRPAPPTRSSWQYKLWSADRPGAAAGADPQPDHPPLRLVPDLDKTAEPAAGPTAEPAAPAPGASQVVSRLAQLLREDPGLASGWGREAPDG